MTKIAIFPDLAGKFAACEDAYEQATQEGYAEKSVVIAACHSACNFDPLSRGIGVQN